MSRHRYEVSVILPDGTGLNCFVEIDGSLTKLLTGDKMTFVQTELQAAYEAIFYRLRQDAEFREDGALVRKKGITR
jgi:hypothetical protein